MSHLRSALIVLFALAALALVVVACATPGPYTALVSCIETATSPESEEGARISANESALIQKNLPPAPIDWKAVGYTAGEIALAILGVKVLPGSVLRGPWDPKPPTPPTA